jgi:hypothetical protein
MIEQFGYGTSFSSVALALLVGVAMFHLTERRWVKLEEAIKAESASAPIPHV